MSAFIVSTETMQRVVHAIEKRCTVFGLYPTEPTRNLDAIGRALLTLNEDAVNDRYSAHPKQIAPGFTYRPLGLISLAAQYNAVACLLYQCSESNMPDRAIYKELDELHNRLAHELARETVNAQKVPWDFPERN